MRLPAYQFAHQMIHHTIKIEMTIFMTKLGIGDHLEQQVSPSSSFRCRVILALKPIPTALMTSLSVCGTMVL